MLGHQQLIDSALTKQHHLVCKHCQVWGGWADSSYRNKHIILYFDFHKSEQFWNISAFYRGQKESQNWYEVNISKQTRPLWHLHWHVAAPGASHCQGPSAMLSTFPDLVTICPASIVFGVQHNYDNWYRNGIIFSFSLCPPLSLVKCNLLGFRKDTVHSPNVPQSLSHICAPNSEIDLVKNSSTYFNVWLRVTDRLISLITQWLENDENVN